MSEKVTVLYQISNHKGDEGDFNAFEMPRNGAGVSLSSIKRHCHALRVLSHCGVDGYHWRVRMDDKAANSREASYSWWDIQDENARLPLKNVSLSDMEGMFSSKKGSSSKSSSSNASASAMKSASGAMRSLGKAMNAVASTVGDDREDPNEPRLDVIAFKLLDLVKVEDSFATSASRDRPARHTPVKQRQQPQQRQQQQQYAQQHQRPASRPPVQQHQQHQQRPAPPQTKQADLMDLVSGGPPQHRDLKKANSAVSPTNHSQLPPRRANSSMPSPSYSQQQQQQQQQPRQQQQPQRRTAPQPKLTRAQQLKKEYEEKARTQNKVFDKIDQRWVEVDPDAVANNNKGSEPPPPPRPQKKIVGIKIDARNAVGKSAQVQAAVQERVKDMEDAQKKAVLEIQRREAETKRDADQEDVVRKKLEPKLRAWSEEYGKKKQLRALLCSLHTILWPSSGWKPVGLGDLVDDKKVRRAYLKASLKVHPDKTRELDVEKRFIAKRVFDALSQAMTEFENKK